MAEEPAPELAALAAAGVQPVGPAPRATDGDRRLGDAVPSNLYLAPFDEKRLTWLPLVFGDGPLTPENGFNSQADVLIETRRAADLLGATPMDRPEEVEVNPVNGCVYVMLTNNSRRTEARVDAVSPRAGNRHGQVAELIPPDGDHTADVFGWEMFLLAGRPEEDGAVYHPDTTVWLSSPDNCAFDPQGRLWIATDQGVAQTNRNRIPDGMYAATSTAPAGR